MEDFFTGHTELRTLIAIIGMVCVTVISRTFFFISERNWHLPHWAQRGLQFAPIAALAAVVAPSIFMTQQGDLIRTLEDARIYSVAVAVAAFYFYSGKSYAVLATILAGMLVYLPLHLGLGW